MSKILLINPPIYDFTAFNLWARPLGLLFVASLLEKLGEEINVIDCLSLDYEKQYSQNNKVIKSKSKNYFTYTYFKEEVEKPFIYKKLKRKYYRFGIDTNFLKELVLKFPEPDVILVTSQMTYWYQGVFEVIKSMKELFPKTPVILGGIYAKLCYEHAKKYSNADFIFTNNDLFKLIVLISELTSNPNLITKFNYLFFSKEPVIFQLFPFLDCYSQNNFVPLITSIGCPYLCKYCASKVISGNFVEKKPSFLINEIEYYINKYKITEIAFYDDALFLNKNQRIIPFLEYVIKNQIKINFHTPNGVHLKEIDKNLAYLLKESGFKTLRFGFESSSEWIQRDSSYKVKNNYLINAIELLQKVGFTEKELGAYILVGLPGQTIKEVLETINFVKKIGIKCKIAEYSPVPMTPYFELSKKISKVSLDEPLIHNKSALSLWSPVFDEKCIQELKNLANK